MSFALRVDPFAAPKEEDFRQDLNVRLTCPDCGPANPSLIEEFGSGDLVCGNCGLVLGDKIVDTRSEWRSFADSEGDDPSRVGGPANPLLDASEQFATIISFKDGNTGAAKALQMAASRAAKASGGGRDLNAAYQAIANMCEAISLPKNIIDTSRLLFKRVDDEKALKGKREDAIIAACIFIACRQARVSRTFKEIVALTKVPKKDIAVCFKLLERLFETHTPQLDAASTDSLITRYCNYLGVSVPVQRCCAHIGRAVEDDGLLAGRNPITIAAASILLGTTIWGVAKPAKDIAKVAGVQDSTIRHAYRVLLTKKEALTRPEWFTEPRADGTKADWENLVKS